MKTAKKIISFDLDGTLVDASYGNMVWLEGVPEKYALRHHMSVENAKRAVKKEYDAVGESHLLWYDIEYWLRRFDLTVSVPELLDRYRDHIKLLPNVAEVVHLLSRTYTLIIASNAARVFVEKELRHTGLEGCFSHVVSATSDFGMVKKEKQFYQKLCSALNVEPCEMIHVGDHRQFDVEIPTTVGIDSYHYDPGHAGNGRAIHDFKELLDLL